jgi:hypothetical protein
MSGIENGRSPKRSRRNITNGETFTEYLKLARSTAECDEGPLISMQPGHLAIRYDIETDTGRIWTTIQFAGAVALRITPDPAVSTLMIQGYSKVGIVKGSLWLASMVGARGDGQLPNDLSHFVVYFDHYGAVETLARSCEVQE